MRVSYLSRRSAQREGGRLASHAKADGWQATRRRTVGKPREFTSLARRVPTVAQSAEVGDAGLGKSFGWQAKLLRKLAGLFLTPTIRTSLNAPVRDAR